MIGAISIGQILIGVFAALGGTGGVIALLRWPSDRDSLTVTTVESAVVIQKNVMDDLRKELARATQERETSVARLEEIRAEFAAQVESLREERDDLAVRLSRMASENESLRALTARQHDENVELSRRLTEALARVAHLEEQVASIKTNGPSSG